MDRSGFIRIVVSNKKELEMLMMHNHQFAATIAHCVSSRNRKEMVQRARELQIRVTNPMARLRTEETQ